MSQQSSCGTCGRPVVWGRRSDRTDKWCPPLDAATAHTGSFIDENGIARQVTVYQGHRCEEADIESWARVLVAREEVKLDRTRERDNRLAEPVPVELDTPDDLKFDMTKYLYFPGGKLPPGTNCIDMWCETCEAQADDPCWSQDPGAVKRGEKRAIKGPHEIRVFMAGVQQHYVNGEFIEEYEAYAKRMGYDLQDYI